MNTVLNALLATGDYDIPLLIFFIALVILAIFFIYFMLSYLCKGIEFLVKPALSAKAGKILFSPAIGIPVFIVLVLTAGLIIFFTNQTEILEFFNEVFGK